MPKIFLTTNGVQESVLRPVVVDILRDISKATGLPENISILYPGDDEVAIQPGSALSDVDIDPNLPFSSKLAVQVDELYNAERLLTTAVCVAENLPVFRDDALQVILHPAYSEQDVTINIRYRAKDKTLAIRWRDDMRMRVSMGRAQLLHSVQYHYLIPEEFIVILKEIHRLREAVAGYGETFEQWMSKYASQRVSQVSTFDGGQMAWAVAETQARIQGTFDFETAEAPVKEDGGDAYTISFAYKFKFYKPLGAEMSYPLVIHNQMIKYRPSNEDLPYRTETKQIAYSLSARNFAGLERGKRLLGNSNGYAIPPYDEFQPQSVPVHTLRVFTALTSIDTAEGANPRFLFNLTQLGEQWELHTAITRLVHKELTWLVKHRQSIFHLSLFEGFDLRPAESLSVDADLNVFLTFDPDLRKYYHVRFAIVDDPSLLNDPAQQRLREDGEALNLIFQALGVTTPIPIMTGNYVSRADYQAALDILNAGKYMLGNRQARPIMSNVMSLAVSAERI